MININEGMAGAIESVVSGLVAITIINTFATIGLPYSYVLLFNFTNLLITVALLFAIPKWGIGYSIGWLISILLLLNTGLIGWEMLLSFLVVLVVLGIRIKN